MDRMTTDNENHGLFFLNTFYGKDGQVWVRGGGPAPGYEDCTLVDFLSRAATPLGLSLDEEDPETVGEIMYDNLQFGPMECDGVLGFLWLAAVQATEMRGRLKMIENILGDNYDLDRIREIVDADREGRCIVSPASIGDTVYHITTCKNFSQVLDGTMYGPDGELGTATGLYCPCELAETCPFPCDDDGSFDCEKHKNTLAIFEDVVTGILSDDMQDASFLEYSGNAAFDDFGKTVFLTREDAEAALRREQEEPETVTPYCPSCGTKRDGVSDG